jgi:hypothetical protein
VLFYYIGQHQNVFRHQQAVWTKVAAPLAAAIKKDAFVKVVYVDLISFTATICLGDAELFALIALRLCACCFNEGDTALCLSDYYFCMCQ